MIREMKRLKKKKIDKAKKKSTYEITADLLAQKMTIEEMAEERVVTPSTIVNHLVRLRDKNKDLDIDFLRPKDKLQNLVSDAYKELKKMEKPEHWTESGRFKLGVLYNFLDREIPYEQLRLCMLFEKDS